MSVVRDLAKSVKIKKDTGSAYISSDNYMFYGQNGK